MILNDAENGKNTTGMTFFHATAEFRCFFHHLWILLICLMYLSLLNLYFYTIRSMTIFLKVVNRVNLEYLLKPKLFLIIDLILFAKLMELLAINHCLSERRIIFAPWLLKFSHVVLVIQLAWVRTSLQFSWIMRSSLVPFPGCQDSCGIVPNGRAGSISLYIRQGLNF